MKLLLKLLLFLLPFPLVLTSGSFDLPLLRILALIIFIFWLFEGLFKKNLFIAINSVSLALLLFLFIAGVSGFWALDKEMWLRKFLFLLNVFLLYFPIAQIYRGGAAVDSIDFIKVLFYSGLIISLASIIQFFAQFIVSKEDLLQGFFNIFGALFYGSNLQQIVLEYPSFFVSVGGRDFLRAFGFFSSPQNLALFVGMVLFLSFYLKDKISKVIFWGGVFLMAAAIIFTLSRGAYLALGLTLIIKAAVEFFLKNKNQVFFKKNYLILALVFLFLTLFFNPFGQRLKDIFSATDYSRAGRLELWQKSLAVFKENSIFGVGLGSLPIYIEPGRGARSPVNAHNTYLEIAAELGLVGFSAFLLMFIFSCFNTISYQLIRGSKNFYILYSIFFLLGYSIFETTIYFFSAMALLTFLLAYAYSFKHSLKHA